MGLIRHRHDTLFGVEEMTIALNGATGRTVHPTELRYNIPAHALDYVPVKEPSMLDKIVRIEPDGPDGKLKLLDRPFPAEIMATDQPIKHGYRYLDDVEGGL